MRVPGATELLDIWEAGASLPLPRRALLLLAAACPEASGDELAALPVGRCDARLLQLYERLFGAQITAVAACPSCSAQLESCFQAADIRLGPEPPVEPIHALRADGYELSFRLPANADLVALNGSADAGSARSLLLARCVIEARNPQGEMVEPESLPGQVVAAVAAQMAVADPQADVQLDLTCPACAHRWHAMFDIAAFLWSELHAWARRTLREVHALGRAYGWREADVLALSPTRRQIYLELSRQ
jgi:hypothetical protein